MPTKRASSSSTQDGMEVTEPQTKKPRTAPTNTSLLPPCKVCFEPAAGFHYGVNTCEACKGFFRRSLLRKEEYKCHGNGNCNIRAGKRKICPKCRHLRCLAVGMSLEDNRCEFRMLCFYHRYHIEWRVYVMPSGQTVCIHQLQKLGKDRCLDDTFECARVLQDLALAHEEVILLKMLVIGTVGRTDVKDSEAVSRFQWSMARCLLWLFRRNRGVDGDRTFARTMLAICRVRDLCREFYEWIDSNPYENYTQYQNNGFLAEWFSAD